MLKLGCWLTRRRLGPYQDGELGQAARARTEAHLAACPSCAAEGEALARLREALLAAVPEPPEAVWEAFWPQVRQRLAWREPERGRRLAGISAVLRERPRLAFGAAATAGAALVLAVLVAPWPSSRLRTESPVLAERGAPEPSVPLLAPRLERVVVQSVETADPQSSVMVFASPEADVTVVWVFGLPRTGI